MSIAAVILCWFSMLDMRRVFTGQATWGYVMVSGAALGSLWGLWFALVLQP
jgi:hypothetical protein